VIGDFFCLKESADHKVTGDFYNNDSGSLLLIQGRPM